MNFQSLSMINFFLQKTLPILQKKQSNLLQQVQYQYSLIHQHWSQQRTRYQKGKHMQVTYLLVQESSFAFHYYLQVYFFLKSINANAQKESTSTYIHLKQINIQTKFTKKTKINTSLNFFFIIWMLNIMKSTILWMKCMNKGFQTNNVMSKDQAAL